MWMEDNQLLVDHLAYGVCYDIYRIIVFVLVIRRIKSPSIFDLSNIITVKYVVLSPSGGLW